MKINLKQHWPSLIVFLVAIFAVQGIGNMVTMPEIKTWYADLAKAPWNPPNAVFGPVWTILYIMIAVVGWRLWVLSPSPKFKNPVMRFYFIQLILNLMWSPLFFGLHQIALALSNLLALLIFVALTMRTAKPVDRPSYLMLIPYFLWLLYAASLNAMILYLN